MDALGERNAQLGPVHAPILAGIERLWANRNLVINGQMAELALWLDGTGMDDSAKTWTCRQAGEVLSEAGSGSSPDLAAYGPHLGERAAEFQTAKYLQASGNEFGDVTTEDLIPEVVFKWGTNAAERRMVNKYLTAGYLVYRVTGTNTLRLLLNDGTNNAVIIGAASDGAWHHGMCFCDRDGLGQWYVDGVASGAAVNIASVGSLTIASPFTLGASPVGVSPYDSAVALVALHKGTDLLDTHLQAQVAKDRAALWMGHTLLHNHGALTPEVL